MMVFRPLNYRRTLWDSVEEALDHLRNIEGISANYWYFILKLSLVLPRTRGTSISAFPRWPNDGDAYSQGKEKIKTVLVTTEGQTGGGQY